MTVSAPPRTPAHDDLPDLGELDALIEEARRRARRRRQRNGAAALVLATGLVVLIGLRPPWEGARSAAPQTPAATGRAGAAGKTVVVTMRGYVRAVRTVHRKGGPAHYREAARFTVVWRVPAYALSGNHTFQSSSAKVRGTTSALFDATPARSCHGTLTANQGPFLLRVTHGAYDPYLSAAPIGFIASPSPIATATSSTCSRGQFAARWKGRTREWWLYNHPGGGFYGPSFMPMPKGGAGEGWVQGWGPAGSFRWLAVFRVHRLA